MDNKYKPKLRFYSNGLLILDGSACSMQWYSLDLNRRVVKSIFDSLKPVDLTEKMRGLSIE